jgi:hypothetical protein
MNKHPVQVLTRRCEAFPCGNGDYVGTDKFHNTPAEPQPLQISKPNQKEPWFGGPIKFSHGLDDAITCAQCRVHTDTCTTKVSLR